MADRYGTAAGVITRTGVKPDDLGLDDDDALNTFLEGVLDEVTELFDRKMRKSYLDEVGGVPAGLDGIANDAAGDSVRNMVVGRQTPVVRIDDFAVRTIASRVLTPDVTDRLKLYTAGQGVGSYDLVQPDIEGLGGMYEVIAAETEL